MIRSALSSVLATIALIGVGAGAHAQSDYPNKPIRLVVPFAAGGPTDILGRVIASEFSARLGQSVVVENKGGATGMIGQDYVSKSAPDGYNIVLITSTSSNSYHLTNRSIDFTKDFSMIGQIYRTYTVLVANPKVAGLENVNNLSQLVAYARANPNKLNFTSSGAGSLGHLTVEKVKQHFKVQMEHVNYKGQALAVQDTLAGRVAVYAGTFAVLPYVKSGQLRPIAIGTAKRSPLLPDTGTFIEQGVAELISAAWVGLAAPGGTPAPIIARLSNELRTMLAKPDQIEKVKAAVGTDPEYLSAAEFTAYATKDFQYWGQVIREAGIKAE